MLDIVRRGLAAPHIPPGIEFLRIELAPLIDGQIHVSLTATTLDQDEPQLLDQEIASQRVANIDEVLALIRAHVCIGSAPPAPLPRQN